jgi:hypothetical protein
MGNSKKPSSTWSFEEGSLTVRHLGKTVALGRYATRDHAAKAAALYIAKRDGVDTAAVAPKTLADALT